MPIDPPPGAAPPPPADPALSALIAALAGMAPPDRHEILAFLDFWRDLPGEDRAVFAKSVKPGLGDEAVARLCGVSRRTLYRWERYQWLKPRLADFQASRKRA